MHLKKRGAFVSILVLLLSVYIGAADTVHEDTPIYTRVWCEYSIVGDTVYGTYDDITRQQANSADFAQISMSGECLYEGGVNCYAESDTTNQVKLRTNPGNPIYTCNWDTSKTQCEFIGGNWTDEVGFSGQACCGDDWVWLNNIAVDYMPRTSAQRQQLSETDRLCMYSRYPDYGSSRSFEDYYGENSYYCDNLGLGHFARDDRLTLDQDNTYANSSQPYYFVGVGDQETDLGKWSDADENKALYCDVDFSNQAGEGVVFSWLKIEDAASKNQAVCDLFLGYGWTGTRCCGAPGVPDSYNDPAAECDAFARSDQLLEDGLTLYDITFQPRFEELCSEHLTENSACFEKKLVKNNTVAASSSNSDVKNIYNSGGELYVCDGAYNAAGFTVVPKCQGIGGLEQYALCTHMNDSWHKKTETYSYDTLGYRSGRYDSVAKLEASIHESSLPTIAQDLVGVDTECCYSDMCWDGQRCTDEHSLYYLSADSWGIYSGGSIADKDIYMCNDGSWEGPLDPEFDWDYNTDIPGFCAEDFQCYCNDCPQDYVDNGCTNMSYFFVDDHLCEEGTWSSRTKALAAHMISVAEGDYTLFCDRYDTSLNYPDPVVSFSPYVNNFCVLREGENTVLGVTFNPLDDSPMDVDAESILFGSGTGQGFIPDVLGKTDIDSCEDALGTGTGGAGLFHRCQSENGKYWYNDAIHAFIYSKDDLSGDAFASDYLSQKSSVESMFETADVHIASNTEDIESVLLSITPLTHARDFRRLYVASQSGETAFGIVEEKYDPEYQDNRNFLCVVYSGMGGVGCTDVLDAYEYSYCGEQGADIIAIGRKVDDDFKFWTDLTAELRYK